MRSVLGWVWVWDRDYVPPNVESFFTCISGNTVHIYKIDAAIRNAFPIHACGMTSLQIRRLLSELVGFFQRCGRLLPKSTGFAHTYVSFRRMAQRSFRPSTFAKVEVCNDQSETFPRSMYVVLYRTHCCP